MVKFGGSRGNVQNLAPGDLAIAERRATLHRQILDWALNLDLKRIGRLSRRHLNP